MLETLINRPPKARESEALALMQNSWTKLQESCLHLEKARQSIEQAERELEGSLFLIDGPDALDRSREERTQVYG